MEVHDLDAAFQDVLDCATGYAGSFADSWQFFVDFVQQQDLVSQQAALLAEVVLGSAQDESLLKSLQDSKDKQGRQASRTRRAIVNWLNELLQQLEPGKLQQYVPAITDTALALVKASTAEDVATKVAALDLLSFVLSQQVAGRLPVQLLPVGPLDLASPMQRVFLSSDARSNKTLKHALLGVLGLLLQLSSSWDPQALTPQQQQRAAAAAASAAGSHKLEQLNRHWLLEMSEAELGVARSAGLPGASVMAAVRFDAATASGGAIDGLVAALSMMQPGEAAQDLAAAFDLFSALAKELAAQLSGAAQPTYLRYGKYTAALSGLQQLGSRMAAAGLLLPSRTPPPVAAASSMTSLQLLKDLMTIAAACQNKDMRLASSAAVVRMSELMCEQLLRQPVQSAVALAWLSSLVTHCCSQLAAGGVEGAAAAGGGGWMRGAVDVLGRLTPAVARHQGEQVWHKAAKHGS